MYNNFVAWGMFLNGMAAAWDVNRAAPVAAPAAAAVPAVSHPHMSIPFI
jgi:hypothetical protein